MEPFLLAFLTPCFLLLLSRTGNLVLLLLSTSISILRNLCLVKGGFGFDQNPNHDHHPLKSAKFSWSLFLGFPPQMGNLAHRTLASLAFSIGGTRLMGIGLGSTRTIISSHPETAKEILCGAAFIDRPKRELTRLLMFDRAIGFSPSGDYWRHLRRITSVHMLSPKRISTQEGHRQAMADKMVDRVKGMMSERGVVEVREIFRKGSLESVLECVLGSVGGGKGHELGLMVEEGYEVMGEVNWGEYFGLGFLGIGGVTRRCHKLGGRVKEVVSEIIRERRESGDFHLKNDFLSVLLSLPQEDQLADSDMVAVLWEMVFRGIDNIAILLEWTMARLVLHRDIQERVQQEIHANIGHSRQIQDSDILNLPYLQAAVKEVLRLHPPGPLLSWARLAIHDVRVDNRFVPAGTTAMVNMWAIAHDPSVWPDPWAFKPERFLKSEFSIAGSDLRLAPFGSGRRACPGRVLAMASVHLWLARFLQQFKWIPAHQVDLGECLKLSLEMKKPLQCYAVDVSKY